MATQIAPTLGTDPRRQLEQEGWCQIPDVLDAQETEEVLERLWSARTEAERRGHSTFLPQLDPNAANVRVFYLLALDAVFRYLIRHPVAIDAVRAVVGDDYLISNFTANIARPGSRSMALHSDQSLVVPEPWIAPWSVNIIWCLTDVRFENGATLFIPGSHRWTTRADVPADADRLLRPFEARAGSIVVMDGRLWHTSGANVTEEEDRALLFGYYTKPFLRPQVNWSAALSRGIQSALSPELHHRLGLGVTANSGVDADLRPLDVQYDRRAQDDCRGDAA